MSIPEDYVKAVCYLAILDHFVWGGKADTWPIKISVCL